MTLRAFRVRSDLFAAHQIGVHVSRRTRTGGYLYHASSSSKYRGLAFSSRFAIGTRRTTGGLPREIETSSPRLPSQSAGKDWSSLRGCLHEALQVS